MLICHSLRAERFRKNLIVRLRGLLKTCKIRTRHSEKSGKSQATIKRGLANVEDIIVPNPVKLQPFRTFHEVEQPEIEFVFRMKNGSSGVSCALFEADGGAWKFNAVHSIAEYLKKELEGVENVAVLS